MNWVGMSSLPETINKLRTEGMEVDFVTDEYSNVLQFITPTGERNTSIVSSPEWLKTDSTLTISINDAEKESDILDGELHSLAQLIAFTSNDVENVAENQIEEYIWNGDTYRLDSSISFDSTPTHLSLQETDFYTVVSHTSRIVGEVILNRHDNVRSHRRQLFDTTGDLARNLEDYSRPLGGTYLTIVKDASGEYYLLLGERSDKVVFWPNRVTAFPAGYFKPTNVSYGTTVEQHVLAEYSRELMNSSLRGQADDTSKGVSAVSQLLRADQAWFEVTGFGIEGFTVSGELTGVLCIENEDYTEYLFENLEESYDVSNVTAIPLNENTESKIESLLLNAEMTPQTLFTLGQGLAYISDETDIPFELNIDQQFV